LRSPINPHLAPWTSYSRRRLLGGVLVAAALLAAAGCGERDQVRLARRILQDHRTRARVKPLAAAQVLRLQLRSQTGRGAGTQTIEWDGINYRETVSSACWKTVRGIQAGREYFSDEDGVTRVAADPLLHELVTRFYFWRRAYLFDDQQEARVDLGPADGASVSVKVTPRGGDPLLLTFDRRDLRLLSARARHFDLVFSSPTRLRDSSRRESPVDVEMVWTGLPTGMLADTASGGWIGRWSGSPQSVALSRLGRALTFPAHVSGEAVTLALDAAVDGPLRVRGSLADRLKLAFTPDVFDRTVAGGASLQIGDVSFPSLVVEKTDSLPEGIDAAAGGTVLRETVVEIDPESASLRLHDPARWVIPQGFFRGLVDDDGNRAAAILQRKGLRLRLLGPTATVGALVLTPEAARRFGVSGQSSTISGLFWGAPLADLSVSIGSDSDADFGEDGRLGWDVALAFHVFFDLPHRWAYLKARR
jgi:hypothetical protein